MLSDEWLSRYGLLEKFNASVTRTGTGTGTWTTGVTAIALCTSCSRANNNNKKIIIIIIVAYAFPVTYCASLRFTHVCLLKGIHVYIVVVVVTKREAQTGRGILWAAIFVVNSGKFVHFWTKPFFYVKRTSKSPISDQICLQNCEKNIRDVFKLNILYAFSGRSILLLS